MEPEIMRGREINPTREDKYDVMLFLMGNLDLNIYVCVFVYVVCMYMGYKSRRGVYEQEDSFKGRQTRRCNGGRKTK